MDEMSKPTDIILKDLIVDGQLNPIYEAYLKERLQYDGDIPELRTGPLPEGATPAIPVVTDAMNPVLIGWLLTQAAEQIQHLLSQNTTELVGYDASPMAVDWETVSFLHMDDATRQGYAKKFLTTTQGRRTATHTIERRVNTALGYTLQQSDTVVAEYEWTVNLEDNPQPNFDFLSVASRAIAGGLKEYQGSWVRIKTVDRLSDKTVGWVGVLYQ